MTSRKLPAWLDALTDQEITFVKNFLIHSGSLKEMAALYEMSYPTLRLRLNSLIGKVVAADQAQSGEFENLLKDLTFKKQLDVEAAHRLLAIYQRDRQVRG